MPRTSRKAVPNTISRRIQYTRAGSGPRVSDGHGVTLVSGRASDRAATPRSVRSTAMKQPLHAAILDWYDAHARDLPWREPTASPWSVMVSEFMLQQTPVARVLPVHAAWLERWPTPAALAAEPAGEAVRAWGRLGYPRRALRLHAAATAIAAEHGGEVPTDHGDLLALPGVGDYTAAAIASFAHGQRHAVLDTNVRRVLARVVGGREFPGASVTRAERSLAEDLLPEDEPTAATWSVAVMELGALVCTAATPSCERCPVADACALARGRLPGVRRTGRGRPRPGPAPTASAAGGCSRSSGTATARSTAAGWRARGRPATSASAAWRRWSPTACSSRRRTRPTPCPDPPPRRRRRRGRGPRAGAGTGRRPAAGRAADP